MTPALERKKELSPVKWRIDHSIYQPRNSTVGHMMHRVLLTLGILSIACSVNAARGDYLSAEDLASVADIGGSYVGGHHGGAISVSPDGKWIAFQLQIPNPKEGTFTLSWMTMPAAIGGKPKFIADGGEVNLNPFLIKKDGMRWPTKARWAPDSKRFAYTLRQDGETQIWVSEARRKGQRKLTKAPRNVIDDLTWSRDGRKIYYHAGISINERSQHFLDEEKRGFLFDARFLPSVSRKVSLKRCDKATGFDAAIHVSIERECEPVLRVYDFNTRSERLATDKERNDYLALKNESIPPEFSVNRAPVNFTRWAPDRDQERYAWLQNEDPDLYRGPYPLLRLHAFLDGREYTCKAPACLRQGGLARFNTPFWWSENGEEIIFIKRTGASYSRTGLYAWKPASANVRTIYETDGWLSDCQSVSDRLICLYATQTQPRRIVSVAIDDGRVQTLYDANPDFSRRAVTRVEKLEWKDKFGVPTHGHLVYPRNYDPGLAYPLVIVTYQSKGFLRGGVGDEVPVHPLAAEGFFVLGHDMPIDLDHAARSMDVADHFEIDHRGLKGALSSQEAVVSTLVERGLVDSRRVAITGFSNGARQTNYALINSDMVSVGIHAGAGTNPSSYYLASPKGREALRRWKGGAPHDPASSMEEISLALNADEISVPLLINVSDEEMISVVEGVARLQDAGKPVEMYVFPDAYHNKWRPDQRLAVYRRNIQWLKFWLMNKEANVPVSPGQYVRWRTMRDAHCARLKSDRHHADLPTYCEKLSGRPE